MTRTTRDLCQDCWQAVHPDEYCPDLNRYGPCARCGADALIVRSIVANEDVEDCGPVTCTTCGAPVGTLIPAMGVRHLDGIPSPFAYHRPTRS